MAIKVGLLLGDGWTKLDDKVALISSLSDKGFRLYAYLASQKNGFNIREEHLANLLNCSDKTIRRIKKELEDLDLIFRDKTRYTHRIWIGNTKVGATKVKAMYEKEETFNMANITHEDLIELRKEVGDEQ